METVEPVKSKDHWKYRRLMAFLAFVQLCGRAWVSESELAWVEIWAYVFLCAQWALPALAEDLVKLKLGK